MTLIYSGDNMPFKDLKQKQEYNHNWYQRKKLGLPTKTRTKLEIQVQLEHEKQSKKIYRQKQRKLRQEQLTKKFGERCPICGDTYCLQIHKKDGKPHRQWASLNNTEFWLLLSSDDFVQLCFNCHKAVHWCMYYLGMEWEDIQFKAIPIEGVASGLKNRYHA